MNKAKAVSISKYILKGIGIAGLITIAVIAPNSLQMLKLFGFDKKRYKPQSVYVAFKRLQKKRLIEIREKNGKTIIIITDAGKKRLLAYNFEEMKIKKPKKWDGKWRIVGFDIPEKYKRVREALRFKLKELGFLQIQKSLFVYPYPCREEIEFIGEIFQINKYIIFIETASITNEDYLKRKFKIR
jgi:DNA-binding transcriptional regulator PaaX